MIAFDSTTIAARRSGLTAACAGVLLLASPAGALEEGDGEWDALKACEKRLCTIILEKETTGEDLSCTLVKTWPKTTLNGSDSKLVQWGFGDARCSVDLSLMRAEILNALTLAAFSFEIPQHLVRCEVESGGELQPVRVSLAPRIEFKKGKAQKVWVNLKDVSGPATIKTTVWAAANLEDSLGIFHKSMLKSINKFMHKRCPKRYGPDALSAEADENDTKKKAEKSATPSPSQPDPATAASASSQVSQPEPSAAAVENEAAKPAEAVAAKSNARPAGQVAKAAPVVAPTSPAAKLPEPPLATKSKPKSARSAVKLQLRTVAPWNFASDEPWVVPLRSKSKKSK